MVRAAPPLKPRTPHLKYRSDEGVAFLGVFPPATEGLGFAVDWRFGKIFHVRCAWADELADMVYIWEIWYEEGYLSLMFLFLEGLCDSIKYRRNMGESPAYSLHHPA